MNTGDYVTGTPASPTFRKKYPSVTGELKKVDFEFLGETITTNQVVVKYDDGAEANVDVDEDSLRVASPRRHPVTVLEVPDAG